MSVSPSVRPVQRMLPGNICLPRRARAARVKNITLALQSYFNLFKTIQFTCARRV